MNKKGVSTVIATVLLLLLTIASIAILIAFVIPFVKDNLAESGNCSDVFGGLEVVDNGEGSCYDPDEVFTKVRVRRGNIDIDGVYLVFENAGSESFEISEDGNPNPDITITTSPYGGAYIPKKGGGEIEYTLGDGVNYYREVLVGAIVNGKRCGNPVHETLKLCIN
tara:strand:- start:22 stop:519 length:498 start_codon:yes stop_codon:yes gene_type:complete